MIDISSVATGIRYGVKPVMSSLLKLTPKNDHVVIHCAKLEEDNVHAMAKALEGKYKIYFLVGSDCDFVKKHGIEKAKEYFPYKNTKFLPDKSLRALDKFLTAKTVFTADSIFLAPHPTKSQQIIWVNHGEAVKGYPPEPKYYGWPRATYLTANSSPSITAKQMANYNMTAKQGKLIGNPRTDFFFDKSDKSTLSSLSIDPEKPFVVYMPTFRESIKAGKTVSGTDVKNPEESAQLINDYIVSLHKKLEENGIQLILKKHPYDAVLKPPKEIKQVTGLDLIENNIHLYEVLGHSDGLITDYSSVWVDYLAMPHKPIALYMPDFDEYDAARGVNHDYYDSFPGIRLTDKSDVDEFIEAVYEKRKDTTTPQEIEEYLNEIDFVRSENVADDILNWLQL